MNNFCLTHAALLIVDVQNDFLSQGSLPVPDAETIIPIINQLIVLPFAQIIASLDWHPKNHISFAKTHNKKIGDSVQLQEGIQKLWPEHCVEGSWGSHLAAQLQCDRINHYVYKGSNPSIDSYSVFFDNFRQQKSNLEKLLIQHNIDTIYLVGLATDFCVLYTALDALELGFKLFLIPEACKAVKKEQGENESLQTMQKHGAKILSYKTLLSYLKVFKKSKSIPHFNEQL